MSKQVLTPETEYMVKILEKLVNIPSPSGYAAEVMEVIKKEAEGFGFDSYFSRKGSLVIQIPAADGATEKDTLGITAHGDTLGAMVRSITPYGTLHFACVGGYMMESIEGTYCKIHTRTGKVYTGTILTTEPSVHTYDDARTQERKVKNMEVRIDEIVKNEEDVKALEIFPGDYISFDPMFRYSESGFINSRHLDDKASVAILLTVLKYLSETGKRPERPAKIVLSNFEEVGHGGSWMPEDITEFLAVDMAAIGDDLSGDEYTVTICAMDSSGPYHYELTNRLIEMAKEKGLNYTVDIFPHYGSDVSAALRAGHDIKGALIGHGVHASHGTERTHVKGLEQTYELVKGYLGV